MALNLNLKSLEGLPGNGERYVKAIFRGQSQNSVLTKAKEVAYFGQHLSWPVGRKLEPADTLTLRAYNRSKYRGSSVLGSLTISLELLITEGQISVRENLVDSNNAIIRTLINFEVVYTFPDSAMGGLRQENFDYPLYDLEATLHGKKKVFRLPSEKGSDDGDDINSEMDYNDDRGLGDGDDVESDSSLLTRASYGIPSMMQPLVMKPVNYQLQIKIIEAKQLMGSNINPRVEVACGNRVHYTDLKMSTNNPFYNQIFVEDFFLTQAEMNDIVIRLRVHHIDSKIIKRIFPAKVIGEFSIDVRTILEQEDNSFQDKWALLIDPKEAMDIKGRGYIKCDLIIHSPGHRVKVHPKKMSDDQEENIEGNLLLPKSLGSNRNRQLAEISVKIHRAEDLPCMNNDLMATVKRAVGGNLKSMVDPLVEVSYAGLTGKTKYKSSTYTPEWNQEVAFLEMFPPFCRRIRLSLCDWNLIRDDVIATHYIELDKIWKMGKDGKEDMLPTFGPSWVNFYGTPRQYGFQQTVEPTNVLDKSLGQGAAYRGRVLMAIKTGMYFDPDSAKTGVKTYPVNQASQFVCGKKEGYVLYGTMFQATVIDPEIAADMLPFTFEMSIGLYGNTLDKISSNDMALEEKQSGGDASGNTSGAKQGGKDKEAPAKWYNPTTPPCVCKKVELNGKEYFHVPFSNKKPNLFVRCYFEDQRFRMGVPNILDKLRTFFTSQEGQIMAQEVRSLADMSVMSIEEDVEIELQRDPRIYRVPRGIRPVRATFRLEAILWGVRDLKPIFFMGVTRPKISLEICGYRLHTNIIKNAKKNPNFTDPLMQKRIRLPSDTRFWPPLAIVCLEIRRFGPTAFVGQHILTRTFDYYLRDETHPKEMRDSDLESEVEEDSDEFAIPDSADPETTANVTSPKIDPGSRSITNSADIPGEAVQVKVTRKPTKEELEEIDWWSRFYVTMDSINPDMDDDIIRKESSSDAESDVLEDIQVEIESEDDGEEIAAILERDIKKKKRKRRKKKKKKKNFRIPLLMKNEKELFEKEEEEDIVFETASIKDDKSWIERIKFYPCPLEKVKDFDGFHTPLKSYELLAGKREDETSEDRTKIVGKLKANFLFYRIDEDALDLDGEDSIGSPSITSDEDEDEDDEDNESKRKELREENAKRRVLVGRQKKDVDLKELRLFSTLPRSSDIFEMLVRVYVIEARDLHPSDPNGLSDPFLVVQLGPEQIINEKDNYKPNTLNPIFGSLFEFECIFPQESLLTIQVFDKDQIGTSDLIGETKIDLESRFLSRHRALCGLPATFQNYGYLKWRDQKTPTSILEMQCRLTGIPQPKYMPIFNKVTVDGMDFFGETEIEDETGEVKPSCEQLALEVLNNWEKLPNGGGIKLVPEHIETRPLYSDETQDLQQGSLLMWVDIFNRQLGSLPTAVDIAPREPIRYVLRVIIHKTDDVLLNNTSMFTDEKSSDIYVKGWMKGVGVDDQSTDVHYRSVTGEGLFNWRFVFPFDYLKAEDKLVYPMKSTLSLEARDVKVPCKLYMQVWDAGLISSDCFLGGMEWSLSRIPQGAKSKKSCGLHQYQRDVPTFSLFRNKRCRCWWPFFVEDEDGDKECTGKVDAELNLIPAEEDDMNPAGRGREEPQALPAPNRPDSSFLNFFGPLKMIYHFLCKKFFWLLIKLLIIGAIAMIFVLFIYNFPGYLSLKLIGA